RDRRREADGAARGERADGGAYRPDAARGRGAEHGLGVRSARGGRRIVEPREIQLPSETRRHARVDCAPLQDVGGFPEELESAPAERSPDGRPAPDAVSPRELGLEGWRASLSGEPNGYLESWRA